MVTTTSERQGEGSDNDDDGDPDDDYAVGDVTTTRIPDDCNDDVCRGDEKDGRREHRR